MKWAYRVSKLKAITGGWHRIRLKGWKANSQATKESHNLSLFSITLGVLPFSVFTEHRLPLNDPAWWN